jgi:CheY-like chemotaxis protein
MLHEGKEGFWMAGRSTADQLEIEPIEGGGTVLVIEDEEIVLHLTRTILEKLGYRALVAGTGREGISIAGSFDGSIDLAILDLSLPDMDGKSVYPRIMEARPGMKVLLSSGYGVHGPGEELLAAGAEAFIDKPFTAVQLSEKLRGILESR